MANEATFASISDLRTAAILGRLILLTLAARGALPAHPALLYGGDITGTGSGVINVPQIGMMGADLLVATADGAQVGNTAITDAVDALTPQRFSKSYEVTDLADWTDSQGMFNPEAFAADAVASWNATMLSELAQMGAGFSGSVGATGVDLSLANWIAAVTALEIANVAGPYLAIIHGQQKGDLKTAAATATGGAIQWREETQTLIGSAGLPKMEHFLGADLLATNHVPTANAGADRAGFMFGAGAVVWGNASPKARTSDQVALGPILFELDRTAKAGSTSYVSHGYMDFAEAIDGAGVGIITDA